MMSETVKIEDIAEVTKLAGFEFTKYIEYNETGEIIALRALNLRNGVLDLTDIKRIDKSISNKLIRSKLFADDILLTYTGNGYGDCAIVEENDKYHLAPNICKITPDPKKVIPYYLYSVIRSNYFYQQLTNYIGGSSQPTIPMKTIRTLQIPFFKIDIQKKIATIMRSINSKIAINTTINENLEQQAQAVFKSWFVDFEPFGGDMPNDWTETTLGKIATISTKSINPLKQPELYLEHYSIPAYDEQHYPVFEYASEIKSNKYILTNNSVLISKLNPDTKRIWRPLCLSTNPVCSTEFIVYEAFNPKHKDYVYSLIDSQAFFDYLCAHTTGSTNSRQRAMPKTTLDFACVLPSDDIIFQFCGIVTPIYDQIAMNLIEKQHLATLRDTLLPKLMNGEIDVSNVRI